MVLTKTKLINILIIVFFAFFFTTTINWDHNYSWHPDERMIIMTGLKLKPLLPWEKGFFSPNSPFNPKFFAYGSLPIYVVTLFKYLFTSDFYQITLHLRWLNFLVLIILGLIIQKLTFSFTHSSKTSLLAFWFTFTTFFLWQNAHFYTVDLSLTLWFTLTLYLLIRFWQTSSSAPYPFFVGLVLAAGLATKFTMILIFPLVFFIFILKPQTSLSAKPRSLIITFISFLIFFFLFQPYAFIDFITYKNQLLAQIKMSRSAYTFPYTLQYVNTPAYIYPLKQIILWGIGPFLSFLALLGVFFALPKFVEKSFFKPPFLIFTAFNLFYFAILGKSAVKFMRYYLPLYPLLIILSALGIFYLSQQKYQGRVASITFFLVSTLFFTSFAVIHLKTPTRLQAARWLDAQYPIIKTIGVEHWDDRLPTRQPFKSIEFPMYNFERTLPTQTAKRRLINHNLFQIDAYVIASPRLYKPLLKLAHQYPVAAAFYTDLFNLRTPFEFKHSFTNYPKFLFWTINDSSADESFYVYDHPPVFIFTKKSTK